jgi:hypothetical protein
MIITHNSFIPQFNNQIVITDNEISTNFNPTKSKYGCNNIYLI